MKNLFISLVLLALINSCSYNDVIRVHDVYVAGYEDGVAKYWKNGEAFPLSDGTRVSYAYAITVVGSDVYVAGVELDGTRSIRAAKYWKNGIGVSLTDGTKDASTRSIDVVNNDVYVGGYENNGTNNVAKYWKNGIEVILSDGTQNASATIKVVGNDIHLLISEYNTVKQTQTIKYWKNGQFTSLLSTGKYLHL